MKLDVAKTCKNCKFAHFNGAQRFGICTFLANGIHPPDEKNLLYKMKSHLEETGSVMSLSDLLGDLESESWRNNRIADWNRFVAWAEWHEAFDDVAHRINAGNVCDEWVENKRSSMLARKVVSNFNKGETYGTNRSK